MKVARIYPNFQVDFKYTEHYLAQELSKDGHQTIFITSDKYLKSWKKYQKTFNGTGLYKYKHYNVIRLKALFPFEKTIIVDVYKFYKLLLRSDFDILHVNGVGTFTSVMVLWMHLFVAKNKPPIIISDHSNTISHQRHGVLANIYYNLFKVQLIVLRQRISKIITFSSIGVDVLSSRFNLPISMFSVIPLGYNQNNYHYRPGLKNSENKMVLGFAGKITPDKRIDYLINELDSLDIKNNIKLIIAGVNDMDQYCKRLRKTIQRVSFEVELRPFLNIAELSNFYNYIDLAVFPGSISITTIEASGCGVPVLLYESISNLDERITNGRGKLFKTSDELKRHIKYYWSKYKSNDIDNLSIANITRENYSWMNIKMKYLSVYEEILNQCS